MFSIILVIIFLKREYLIYMDVEFNDRLLTFYFYENFAIIYSAILN